MGVAPTAMQCLMHPDGEAATARACRRAKVVMGLSSFSTTSLEEVARESGDNPRVLQLYLFEEREHGRKLIRRAKRAGYRAVFLIVDTPMLGRRNLEIRNQFRLPKHLKVANFHPEKQQKELTPSAPKANEPRTRTKRKQVAKSTVGYHDGEKRIAPSGPIMFHTHAPNPTLTWEDDIAWLKKECRPDMQVWVKGIATGEDARLAVHHGCDGIVVSNHGDGS